MPHAPIEPTFLHALLGPPKYCMCNTTQVSLATTEAKNDTSCWVDVLDSQNVVTDSKQVFFSVLATTFDNLAVSDGVRESLNGGDSGSVTCLQRCGSIFSFWCLQLKGGCSSEIARGVATIVCSLVLGATSTRFSRTALICTGCLLQLVDGRYCAAAVTPAIILMVLPCRV